MMKERDSNFLRNSLNELVKRLGDEKSYNHVLSSMCTPPSSFTREIASIFAEINLGDPGLFPEVVKMEKEVLFELANLLNAPDTWEGSITSGGSESNLIGCWVARNWARKNKNITNGTIIFPQSAHVSFDKAADILNLSPIWIPLNKKYQIDINLVNEAITKNTIGIVGIAGTTGTGICDDIKGLSDLAIDNNLYLHVDAAHGGTIYPYFSDLGLEQPKFAFEHEGVKSATIDTHKIMGGLIPSGSIIFRNKSIAEAIAKNITYLSNSSTKQITITGTRPGNSVIAAWFLFKKLGKPYLLERLKNCLEKTRYLVKKLTEIEQVKLAFEPIINIVGFTINDFTSNEFADNLRQKGWKLSIYNDWIRIVVMPHVTKDMTDQFISDIKISLNKELK